ncbi:MAG: hypothetical protein P4L72_05840 [Parvibaculum sp.]|uniref:hypothetical protein n=1 Tax=Parvibaculum sp. TaxID=2024848 RepID=UPI00284FCF45|nr:hypothetical protein [Parvibaculum sp.]MDR3498732.1 hypothetical protein [Parvibaculum sp.]
MVKILYVTTATSFVLTPFCILYAVYALSSRLRKNHNAEWVLLGSPTLLTATTTAASNLVKFIFGSGYKAIDDPVVVRLVVAIRCLFAAGVSFWIALKCLALIHS